MLMQNRLIPLTLEQHQQILYEILYMVDDFCKAHDIPYFLVGGSLLGAVRHQGIIPWDDDVDIAMTRENYERFIEKFHVEGVEGYELLDFRYKDGYLIPYAKMAKCNTKTSLEAIRKIYIDIFPYDGCADNLKLAQAYFTQSRQRVQRFMSFIDHGFTITDKRYNWKGKTYYFLTHFLPNLMSHYPMWLLHQTPKNFLEKMHHDFTKYGVSEKKYSANIIWGMYGKGEVQPSSSFLHLEEMRFGTRKLPVPSGWHNYLTGIYGDYMIPLPEHKRMRHTADTTYLIIKTED